MFTVIKKETARREVGLGGEGRGWTQTPHLPLWDLGFLLSLT